MDIKKLHAPLRWRIRLLAAFSWWLPFHLFSAPLPPGEPDVTHPDTRLYVEQDFAMADGTSSNRVRAHIVDEFGVPVANQDVHFQVDGSLFIYRTDDNGNAYLSFAKQTAGTVAVSARVNGKVLIHSTPIVVTFISGPPDPTVPSTYLEVVVTNAIANGSDVNRIKAHVTDANGNIVANRSVTFFLVSGTGTIIGSSAVLTNTDGEAFIDITSTVAGDVHFRAEVNGANIISGSPAIVTFVADVPDLSANGASVLEVVANNAKADGTATNSVRALIRDANGNPVANQTIEFLITDGNGIIVGSAIITTDANGEAVVEISSTVAGNVSIRAELNGVDIPNGSPAIVVFVADDPDLSEHGGSMLAVVADNAVANGTATNSVKAVLKDANGNPVANQIVGFFIVNGNGTIVGTAVVTTDVNGEALVEISSTVAGEVSLRAEVNGNDIVNGSPAIVRFVADVPDISENGASYLEVVADNAIANGTAANSVKAVLKDANGNPVASQTVEFFIVDGNGTIVGSATVTTDENGEAFVAITSTVAGDVSLRAELNGIAIVNGSPAIVRFVADVPDLSETGGSRLEVVSDNAVANGTAANSVKAVLKDANGNPVANQTVEFFIVDGNGTIVGSATATTDENGEALVEITSTVAGEVSLRAELNGIAIVNGSPAVVTFTADVPDLSETAGSRLEIVSDNAIANGTAANSVKAVLKDAHGNPVPDQTVTFFIVDGNGTIVGSATVTTDANGEAIVEITSTVVGEVSLRAELNGVSIVNGSPAVIRFIAGPADISEEGRSFLEVENNNAVANGTAKNSVKAVLRDANGNPIGNQIVEFFIVDGEGTIVGSTTVATNGDGEAMVEISSTIAGSVALRAEVNGQTILNGSPAVVTFVADDPDLSEEGDSYIEVVTNKAVANGVATNSVKAVIRDANGNPVPLQMVVFFIVNGSGAFTGAAEVTTNVDGEAIIELTSQVPGIVTIRAEISGMPVMNGSPAEVEFVNIADPQHPETILLVVQDNAMADGNEKNSVKAHVVAFDGTALSDKSVHFEIASGNASIVTPQPVMTDANGDAVILVTSTTPGRVQFSAMVDDKLITNGNPATVKFVTTGVWVPKVFTPNGDGKNDLIAPIITGFLQFEFFTIYNRWGNLVFSSTDRNKGWDGRLKGVPQPNETYLWIISGTDKDGNRLRFRGAFSLVR